MFSPTGTLISASAVPYCGAGHDTVNNIQKLLFFKVNNKRSLMFTFQLFLTDRSILKQAECTIFFRSKTVYQNAFMSVSPRSLTFTWWECYGLCLWHEPTELAHSCLFYSCVNFSLYGPFDYISFHKFLQLSVFSLCSTGLISASLVFSSMSLSESLLQPWYNP